MSWKNVRLIFMREVRDQLRDRRTLFMITVLPVLLYPMLGLGVVQMMLTFSEQKRVVVVLNADDLPEKPALLDGNSIHSDWYENGQDEPSRLRILAARTNAGTVAGDTDEATLAADIESSSGADHPPRHGEKTDAELLVEAHGLAEKIATLQSLSIPSEATEDSVTDRMAIQEQRSALQDLVSAEFGESGFQVLVLVPKGYRAAMLSMQDQIKARSEGTQTSDTHIVSVPPIMVVRNSADDKSSVAFARVQKALTNWEDAIRRHCFDNASLPVELEHPARLSYVEVAREEQVAASVWSKMFPALLVIMSLTGAFYPAIDLGAGEKERGTMETLLISPARRIELVLGKFLTIMLFSVATAVLNLCSMGLTGQQMASGIGRGIADTISLEFPGFGPLMWMIILLLPLSALFSSLCLALATFARSTKEGQYYLTPLLMVVMGLTMFCLSPSVEMTPLYSVIPVVNVTLLLKGLLLNAPGSGNLVVYAVPVLISSIGYSMLSLWWAIELYNSEDVLFREAEKFDLRLWFRQMLRTKDAVPVFPEAVFCFILILMLQFVAMKYMATDLNVPDPGSSMLRLIVVQQLTMIACPALFMGLLLTTSLRATFRLRMPSLTAMGVGVGLAVIAHPLSMELSRFLVEYQVFPELPESARHVMELMKTGERPTWLLLLVFAVTPAICEELAFRGFILSGLARGGRLAIAVGISSIMFGIIHMIPQQAFNAALLGLVLGLLAIYSRSLFPAMAFHFCNNALATFYSTEPHQFNTDGVFLSRHPDGQLCYEAPLLLLCGIVGMLLIMHMIKVVSKEQDLKRRGLLPAYQEASAPV
ncbi:MAG: ABC transporter permease subunit [Planctomycetales bacterium]|nr:ABC transporter permease subunit [Planctomycetales bacterium]